MKKYAYILTTKTGLSFYSIQKYKFDANEVLKVYKENDKSVVKCEYFKEIPNGYHLCGCGNIAYGTRDELCDECREYYGHYYAHEL